MLLMEKQNKPMSEVTALKQLSKGRVQVILDGEPAFVLYKGEAGRLSITEGRQLSAAEMEQILWELLLPRAVKRLLFLLGRKDYTEAQLAEKLKEGGYPTEVAERALEALKNYSYVDDMDYARRYLACYQGRKSRGRMRRQLLQRGISRELVDRAFTEWEEAEGSFVSEQDMIRELLQKRRYDPSSADDKEKQKQYAFLARRGFRSSDITAVLFREAG